MVFLLQPFTPENKYYLNLKLGGNNHVYIKWEHHYYSAPYLFIGQQCNVIFKARSVSIYVIGQQIAFHLRFTSSTRYTTNPEHLAKEKRYILELSPEKLLERGRQISPVVEQYLQQILIKPIYVEHAYKSCEGVLSFSKKQVVTG